MQDTENVQDLLKSIKQQTGIILLCILLDHTFSPEPDVYMILMLHTHWLVTFATLTYSNGSIEDHFRDSWSRVKDDIDSTDESTILNTDTDELVNYYYENIHFQLLKWTLHDKTNLKKTTLMLLEINLSLLGFL
ncbi:MAG: hypothetical protein K5798_03905 [Nitrosopumilus sp.]|nr:hypothetical protein [Nitrosopumilus sp.]